MIWTITKWEFLSNIKSLRFSVGFAACLILVVISSYILTDDYQQRLQNYQLVRQDHWRELQQVRVYSQLRPWVDRPPEVLSIFCEGMDKRVGNSVQVSFGEVPAEAEGFGRDNPLLSIFPSVDIVLVFAVILGLLAILFSYDAISGEKERGSLKQLLANSLPRHQVLLGKYLGSMLSLLPLVVMSLITGIFIVLRSPLIALTLEDGLRIFLLMLFALVYLSVFVVLGLFISACTHRSFLSLLLLLFLWVTFVFIIPNGSLYLATQLRPNESPRVIEAREKALWEEFHRKIDDFQKKDPRPKKAVLSGSMGIYSGQWRITQAPRVFMEWLRRLISSTEPLRIEYATRVWNIRRAYLDQLEKQVSLARSLSRLSPSSVLENIATILCRTDLESYLQFMDDVRAYRHSLIDYLKRKKAFSSLAYFTPKKEDEILDGEEYRRWLQEADSGKRKWPCLQDYPPLDLSDLPQFIFRKASLAESLGRSWVDIVLLLITNAILFLLAHISFLRYDVR